MSNNRYGPPYGPGAPPQPGAPQPQQPVPHGYPPQPPAPYAPPQQGAPAGPPRGPAPGYGAPPHPPAPGYGPPPGYPPQAPYAPPPGAYGQPPGQPAYGPRPGAPVPQYAGPQFAGAAGVGGPIAVRPMPVADPHRGRRVTGLVLWILGVLGGAAINVLFQLLSVFNARSPDRVIEAMFEGALFALLPLAVYLFVPWIIDRFDPEPWWCLAMAFIWGALAATGGALIINTGVEQTFGEMFGRNAGTFMGACVSAPLAEEFFKGLAILGFFYFLRREFDGIVDAIIYATFCALGFAAIENVLYYKQASLQGGDRLLATTFVLRGVLTPWLHPLFTSMTGIGFGIARETTKTWARFLAPLFGYALAVSMHATWNFVATVSPQGSIVLLPLWILFNIGFFFFIIALVVRKGRVIRANLKDEIWMGNLTAQDVDLICSPVGRLRATFSWRGATGRAFIKAGARLALSKWHTARAMKGQKRTISADFIVPLRAEVMTLRGQLMARAPRA